MPSITRNSLRWRSLVLAALLLLAPGAGAAYGDDEALFRRALGEIEARRYPEATDLLRQLTRRRPSNGLYWFNLATAQFNGGDYEAAAESFRRVIRLKSPLRPAAQLCLAKCLRKLGRFDEAQRQLAGIAGDRALAGAVESERRELSEAPFSRALASYEAKRFEQASVEFDAAARAGGDAKAWLMKGLSLLHLDRPELAREAFRQALTSARDAELRDHARYFLDTASSRRGRGTWSLFTDLGAGYSSNVFLDGNNVSPVTREPLVQLSLGAGYQAADARPYLFRFGYQLYLEEFPSLSEARFLSQSLRGAVGFVKDDWSLRLLPSLQHQILGSDPYVFRPALGLRGEKAAGPVYLGLQYELSRNIPQKAAYSYLEGDLHAAQLYAGIIRGGLDAVLNYHFGWDAIGDQALSSSTLPLRGTAHGPSLQISWFPGTDWELGGSLGLSWRGYSSPAQPTNATRSDTQLALQARAYRTLAARLRAFVTFGYLRNRSSLDGTGGVADRNFEQVFTTTGISWDILN